MLPKTKLPLLAPMLTVITTALFATPVLASTKDDLKQCKTAIQVDKQFAAQDYSVKFRSIKGNTRNKTIRLRLQDKSHQSKYTVDCKIHRGEVIDLKVHAS